MAFLIPDNLKSKKDSPNYLKRIATALQHGLDDSVQIWLKPIYHSSNGNTFFIVLIPNRGIAVLNILETKGMKILGLVRNKLRLDNSNQEVELDNPIVTAQEFAGLLETQLATHKELDHIPIVAGLILPSLEAETLLKLNISNHIPNHQCIFKDVIDTAIKGNDEISLEKNLARIFNFEVIDYINEKQEKLIRSVIDPDTTIKNIGTKPVYEQLSIFKPDFFIEDTIAIMDRQQEAIAKSIGDGHRIIRGVAGSGKTLILVYRAKLLAKSFPQNNYLYTCYTKTLAHEIREILKPFSNIDVVHLDGLFADIIRQNQQKHPGYEKDQNAPFKLVIDLVNNDKGPRYHAIYLDEAQDFDTKTLSLITKLLVSESSDLLIVADAAQNIFRRSFSWKQAGIQAQGRTKILRVNYRNTKEILEFASSFLLGDNSDNQDNYLEDENAIIPPESTKRNGPKPTVKLVDTPEIEIAETIKTVKKLVNQVKENNQIAILYPSTYNGNLYRAKELRDRLCEENIDVYWVNDTDKTHPEKIAKANAKVILSTIHSAKGLEFNNVVMCGLFKPNEANDYNKKLAYVGMTRASHNLMIICENKHELIKNIKVD